jgi:hypothetical protein
MQLLAHAQRHLVRDCPASSAPPICSMRAAARQDARQLEGLAEVAVTTGDGDHRTRRIDRGPGTTPSSNRAREPEHRPATSRTV